MLQVPGLRAFQRAGKRVVVPEGERELIAAQCGVARRGTRRGTWRACPSAFAIWVGHLGSPLGLWTVSRLGSFLGLWMGCVWFRFLASGRFRVWVRLLASGRFRVWVPLLASGRLLFL